MQSMPDHAFTEILQAKAGSLLTQTEARAALRTIRPQWFTEPEDGAASPEETRIVVSLSRRTADDLLKALTATEADDEHDFLCFAPFSALIDFRGALRAEVDA